MMPQAAITFPHGCGNNTSLDRLNSLLLSGDPCVRNLSGSDPNDTAAMSSLLKEFRKSLYLLHEPRIIALLCLYAAVFMLSIVGNSLVIIVISGQKGPKSSISLFLLTMAIADLIVATVCAPTTMSQAVYRGWLIGDFFCKLPIYAQGVASLSSIYTVVLMSLDRFLSIRYPVFLKRLNAANYTRIAIVAIWMFAGLVMIPSVLNRTTEVVSPLPSEPVYFCVEAWSSPEKRLTFSLARLFIVYVVSCTALASLYSVLGKELWASEDRMTTRRDSTVSVTSSRAVIGRKRVARTSIFIAGVFIISWLPYDIFSTVTEIQYRHTDRDTLAAFHFTLWLGHANCAIKPVLYCFMGSTFRRKMIKLVMKCNPVCKRQVFTVAYQMDPSNFQWTLADYGLAAGASPRPSFASWNTSLPSPMSCYSLHWPLSDNQTPRASISTQSRSYQHSPRSSVGFLSPHEDYSPRGSFCDGRDHGGMMMCYLDTPPFLSPRASLSYDRRGSSVSQQRTPRPSISVEPSGRIGKSPRISVSFEDHEMPMRTSPRGSFCSPRPSIYCDDRPILRSPRHSFCTEEPMMQPQRQQYYPEEKPIFLTTKPYYYYPEENRRSSRRTSMCTENSSLLSPRCNRRRKEDKHNVRIQSTSTSTADFQKHTRQTSSAQTHVANNVTSTSDQSDAFTSPDQENKNNSIREARSSRNTDESEVDDYSPNEMITYSNSRRHSLASNASKRSVKPSSPRSDKSEARHLKQLKRQAVAPESNRSRRSSIATVADSENRSRRGSVITLGDLQENRSRRSSVNTLGENLENRSRRSSVITLGDALENMMRQGSRNTLAESPGNRSQKSSPRSHTPSLRGSPHNHMELELMRSRPPPSVDTVRRASVAAMGDSLDSTGGVREKRRASISDFSETTLDSKDKSQSSLQQQHSFPFGKQEEKHRRPSIAAVEVVDQFLTTRRSSTQINQNGLDDSLDKRSRSRSRSRSPSPNPTVHRKDSIPITRTSPRMSPQQLQDEESDNEHFRPISEIPDSTSRVIEWKKGLDTERPSNDLNERKSRKMPKSPTEQHRNVKEKKDKKGGQDKSWRMSRSMQADNDNIPPIQEYPDQQMPIKIGKRRASYSTESDKVKPQRRPSVFADQALRGSSIESYQTGQDEEIHQKPMPREMPRDYPNGERHPSPKPKGIDKRKGPNKSRRASLQTDDRRHYEQPYYVIDDGYHPLEQPVYFNHDPRAEHLYQAPMPRHHAHFRDKREEIIKEQQEMGRRHSLIQIPFYDDGRKPMYYVETPPAPNKRRASLAFWSNHDQEEMVHMIADPRNHPALKQKRSSLPVIEGIPAAMYYPNSRDNRSVHIGYPPGRVQIHQEPRDVPIDRSVHMGYSGNRGPILQNHERSSPIEPSRNHLSYANRSMSMTHGQRSPNSRAKYQMSEQTGPGEHHYDPRARTTRSRSVSWQCDDVDEEDEEEADVSTALLKNKYMEIAT